MLLSEIIECRVMDDTDHFSYLNCSDHVKMLTV